MGGRTAREKEMEEMIPIDEIPQSDRRRVLEEDRLARKASTYFAQAQASLDDTSGGRYGAVTKSTVTGSSFINLIPTEFLWSTEPYAPSLCSLPAFICPSSDQMPFKSRQSSQESSPSSSPCIVDVSAQASARELNLAPALEMVSRMLSRSLGASGQPIKSCHQQNIPIPERSYRLC